VKGIQWGAVATGCGILFAVANYYGCLPVTTMQLQKQLEGKAGGSPLISCEDYTAHLQHLHRDLRRIMDRVNTEHHGEMPP